jgi:peroxiredoxin
MHRTIRRTLVLVVGLLGLALVCPPAWAAARATLEIGAAAPDFSLPGVDGKTHTLESFRDADVLVVIFTCNHCPTSQAYEDRIKQLAADYKDKKVAVVAISPNDPEAVRPDELGYSDLTDSLEDMKIRAKDKAFNFPYLYDGETQKASRAYGPVATPHVFVFDKARKLRYAGRIDDSEKIAKPPTTHETRDAIEALLAGRAVLVETTKAFGCSTKWSDKRASAKQSLEAWAKEPVGLKPIDESGVRALAKNDGQKARLIVVWATDAGPSVEALAEFVTMNRMYRRRNFELITLSADAPAAKDKVLETLKAKQASATNCLFDGGGKEKLLKAVDEKAAGALPHVVLVAPGGEVLYRKTGTIDPLELKKAIVAFVGRTYK